MHHPIPRQKIAAASSRKIPLSPKVKIAKRRISTSSSNLKNVVCIFIDATYSCNATYCPDAPPEMLAFAPVNDVKLIDAEQVQLPEPPEGKIGFE